MTFFFGLWMEMYYKIRKLAQIFQYPPISTDCVLEVTLCLKSNCSRLICEDFIWKVTTVCKPLYRLFQRCKQKKMLQHNTSFPNFFCYMMITYGMLNVK